MIVATLHRRESWGEGIDGLSAALRSIVERHDDVRMVIPVHPNPEIAHIVREKVGSHPRIFPVPPLSYGKFVHLMSKAYLIVTDSGGIQEEAPSLNVPALVMRETTERGEAANSGQVRLVGRDPKTIADEASRLLSDRAAWMAMRSAGNPFGDGLAGARIALAISRYFDEDQRPSGRLLSPEESFSDTSEEFQSANAG